MMYTTFSLEIFSIEPARLPLMSGPPEYSLVPQPYVSVFVCKKKNAERALTKQQSNTQ